MRYREVISISLSTDAERQVIHQVKLVEALVEMIEPFKGRVYDPCCGSSGMFVQSEEFIRAHGGRF